MNTKFEQIALSISRRVSRGDYSSGLLPSERELAGSLGVCQRTLRRAVQKLIEEEVLSRRENGRLEVAADVGGLQVALLAPAWNTPELTDWYRVLARMTDRYDFSLRLVYYFHPDDPVIPNTVRHYECTFMVPPDPCPDALPGQLLKAGNPFFILNNDWSMYGVPSLIAFPPVFVEKMLEHLSDLGHTRIDCLNVQPGKLVIPRRIEVWHEWITRKGMQGELFNRPVKHYTNPVKGGYILADNLICEGKFDSKAFFCITEAGAQGVVRAMLDHGIMPGLDVSIAVADSLDTAEYYVPPLTSMGDVDMAPAVNKCFKWLTEKNRVSWKGGLILQPEDIEVVVRQSTVWDIERRYTPQRMLHRQASKD